ncbi:MAG: cytochrome c [Proteobacteria bacterium]|nr:cytochrome c [Pseudomonadota bacterium]
MNVLTKLLIAAAAVVIGSIGFAYSGIYDVSASSPHGGLTNWLLSRTSHASVARRARSIVVPELTDMSLVRAGVNDFDSMCAACHGAPGKGPEAMGQGLNPPAPDLAESAAHLNSAELFWITKNGIKMTGMPAWGATHDDDALWPVVAFMTTLPNLDADGYQALLASATGMGHHAEGDDESGHEHDNSDSVACWVRIPVSRINSRDFQVLSISGYWLR